MQNNPMHYMLIALANERRGNFAGAIANYQEALSLEPDNATAHARVSLCLSNLNRRFGAMAEAERALALSPDLPICHVAYGLAALLLDDTKSARDCVAKCLPEHHWTPTREASKALSECTKGMPLQSKRPQGTS